MLKKELEAQNVALEAKLVLARECYLEQRKEIAELRVQLEAVIMLAPKGRRAPAPAVATGRPQSKAAPALAASHPDLKAALAALATKHPGRKSFTEAEVRSALA